MSVMSPTTLSQMQGGNLSQKSILPEDMKREEEKAYGDTDAAEKTRTPMVNQLHQKYPSFGAARKSSVGDDSI